MSKTIDVFSSIGGIKSWFGRLRPLTIINLMDMLKSLGGSNVGITKRSQEEVLFKKKIDRTKSYLKRDKTE